MSKASEVAGLGPATKARDAAGRVVLARLADARRLEPKLGRRAAAAPVHDLRVALRRLRAALQLFGAPRSLDRAVKRTQDALGRVRDRQLRLSWLASLDLAGTKVLVRQERAALAGDRARLRRALEVWESRTRREVARAAQSLAPRGRLAGARVRKRVVRRLGKIEETLPSVLAGAPPQAAHRLRIALKKLRYEAEIASLAAPDLYGPLVEAATPLQALLGDLHDADLRAQWASERAAREEPPEVAALLAVVDRAGEERERAAASTIARLAAVTDERLFARLARLV